MAIRIVNFIAKINNNNCSSTIVVMVIVVIISVIRNHNSSTDSRNILATVIVIGINNKILRIIITTRTVVIIGSMVHKVRSPDPSADVRPQGSTSKVLVQGLGLQKPSSAMIWGGFPKIAGRLWGSLNKELWNFGVDVLVPCFWELSLLLSPSPKPSREQIELDGGSGLSSEHGT